MTLLRTTRSSGVGDKRLWKATTTRMVSFTCLAAYSMFYISHFAFGAIGNYAISSSIQFNESQNYGEDREPIPSSNNDDDKMPVFFAEVLKAEDHIHIFPHHNSESYTKAAKVIKVFTESYGETRFIGQKELDEFREEVAHSDFVDRHTKELLDLATPNVNAFSKLIDLMSAEKYFSSTTKEQHSHHWQLVRRSISPNEKDRSAMLSSGDRYLFHPEAAPHKNGKQMLSQSRKIPRTIAIEISLDKHLLGASYERTTYTQLEENSIPLDSPLIEQNWFTPNANEFYAGSYDSTVCEPMHDWQLQSYPNCNSFHELVDPHRIRMINKGGARIAFELRQHLDTNREEETFVYKTIKYNRSISMRKVEEQRKDSLIMERASGSQFIPEIHGYCSLGIMMDYMPEGNMHDYIKGSRLAAARGGSSASLPSIDKLRIAIHIASSVAELHTTSLFFHNDLCCHQFLFSDGIFKLNDFNVAGPIYVNKENNKQQCKWENVEEDEKYIWKGRSLEEFQKLLGFNDYVAPTPDKVDVWMMGNLIFTILTDQYTFEKPQRLDMAEVAKKLVAGERTPLPEDIKNSHDPSQMAIMHALDMCWTYNWQERPSAQSIAGYLYDQLKVITGEENPDVRVLLPKRDPNQRSTDSDFVRSNCDHTKSGDVKHNCM